MKTNENTTDSRGTFSFMEIKDTEETEW